MAFITEAVPAGTLVLQTPGNLNILKIWVDRSLNYLLFFFLSFSGPPTKPTTPEGKNLAKGQQVYTLIEFIHQDIFITLNKIAGFSFGFALGGLVVTQVCVPNPHIEGKFLTATAPSNCNIFDQLCGFLCAFMMKVSGQTSNRNAIKQIAENDGKYADVVSVT